MKWILCALACVPVLLCSCGERKAVSFLVGGEERLVVNGAKWQDAQDEMIDELKPLWDGLEAGESEAFQLVRTRDKNPNMSAAEIYSPEFRFFKGRDGRDGMEQLDDVRGPSDKVHGENLDWSQVDSYLRKHVLTEVRVGLEKSE